MMKQLKLYNGGKYMKKVIRKGTFETNSSSTHAICICTDKKLLEEMEYPEHLYFGIGEHGWEYERLNTPKEKANYLYTAILYIYTHTKGMSIIK